MSESAFFTSNSFRACSSDSVLELIHESEGGWSALYRIDRDGRFRVLKALKPEYREDIKYETLLRKEYEIGYKLSHPNLCEIYGFIEIDGLGHCIEMEWINGAPLNSFLSKKTLTREVSTRIVNQLCDAVAYCHSRQVIHRDIKPENIMITHSGNNVKLIDFGLSDSDAHSVFKSACGTAVFAAPELFEGAQPDVLSDIFSLGKVISLLHPSFSAIAAKCTREDPLKRYPDVESVKEAAAKVKYKGRRTAVISTVCTLALASCIFLWPLPDTEPEIISPQTESVPASKHSDIVTSPVDSTQSLSQPAIKSIRVSTPVPSAKQVQKSEYDAEDIDELFNMATELVDKGQ